MEEICLRLRAGLHIKSAKFPQHDFYLSCGSFISLGRYSKWLDAQKKQKCGCPCFMKKNPSLLLSLAEDALARHILSEKAFINSVCLSRWSGWLAETHWFSAIKNIYFVHLLFSENVIDKQGAGNLCKYLSKLTWWNHGLSDIVLNTVLTKGQM